MSHARPLPQPSLAPASRLKPETLQGMLRQIERASDGVRAADRSAVSLGIQAIDSHLPGGGLILPGLHHIYGPDAPARQMDGAVAAFTARLATRLQDCESIGAAKPVLWIEDASSPALHGPGLAQFGLDMSRLYLLQNHALPERLWAAEEALRSGAVSGVIIEANRLDLTAARRLLLAAKTGGSLGILLSSAPNADISTGPMSRWQVQMHHPRGWEIHLERCRGAAPASWVLPDPARQSGATRLTGRAE